MRLVGLGGRPAPDASREKAVARLAAALTQPKRSAGRYYFALVIADRSASLVARLLEESRSIPSSPSCRSGAGDWRAWKTGCPDRSSRNKAREDDPDGILVAPTGIWHQAELVHEVQQFTRELLQDFASAPEAGLTSAQLGQLRPDAGDDTAERASLQPPLDELPRCPRAASRSMTSRPRRRPQPTSYRCITLPRCHRHRPTSYRCAGNWRHPCRPRCNPRLGGCPAYDIIRGASATCGALLAVRRGSRATANKPMAGTGSPGQLASYSWP